ncbi:MAG: thiamine diphosphokinase [Acidimicrobiia bacterium]|nr:MAG: thiamine diphosphokinase [Acidimicrobiia bacterium]
MEQPDSRPKRAVIIAGGGITTSIQIAQGDYVIAADSGYDIARNQEIRVDLLVGDLDSITAQGLQHAEASGVVIERFPEAKDKTDFELALEAAIAVGAHAVDIYGGEAGSFGHLLGISTGLTARTWARIDLRWFVGSDTVFPVHPKRPLEVSPPVGTRLTLVPIGDAQNVTATGVQWPLSREPLPRGTSRGLSNITTDPICTVSLTDGALLVIVDEGDPI